MVRAQGFDEHMNIVLHEAVEVPVEGKGSSSSPAPLGQIFEPDDSTSSTETNSRRSLGSVLLKGDSVSLVHKLP